MYNFTRSQAEPIGDNLSSSPVIDCCLTIKLRSPLTPLKKGGTGVFLLKVPLLKGDLGGSRLGYKRDLSRILVLSCQQWADIENE
jgi:hypothetical protein